MNKISLDCVTSWNKALCEYALNATMFELSKPVFKRTVIMKKHEHVTCECGGQSVCTN